MKSSNVLIKAICAAILVAAGLAYTRVRLEFAAQTPEVAPFDHDVAPRTIGVPRIWEKLKAALEAGFAAESDAARREAIQGAVAAA